MGEWFLEMNAVYHATYSCTVDRKGTELLTRCALISTDYEASAQLAVDIHNFKINYVGWDIYRTPAGYTLISQDIPELNGVEAYFYSGSQIRQAVGHVMNGIPLELITECIRGIGQAEAFIIKERGFSSPEQFDEYCGEIGIDSCYYYSNLDLLEMPWSEYMGEHSYARDKDLFYRHKYYTIFSQPDNSLLTSASFVDTFHEIAMVTTLNAEGLITECSGDFMRSPDKICYKTLELLSQLKGQNLAAASKKEIAGWLGGSLGCTHLYEMACDLGKTLADFQK